MITPPIVEPIPSTNDVDIPCPLCNYNLRGLTEPRCPECGYRFSWAELTDPALRLHPFLFEFHPENNTRSYIRTALANLRPARFWKSLSPVQRPRLKRLFLYWAVYSLVYALPLCADLAWTVHSWGQSLATQRAWEIANWKNPKLVASDYSQRILTEYGSFQAYLDSQYPTKPLGILKTYLRWCGILVAAQFMPLILPWLVALALSIYQASMLRSGILPQHVIRCVIYSCDVLLWITPLAILIGTLERLIPWTVMPMGQISTLAIACVPMLLLASVATYRLIAAYRGYMRLDRPVGTVAAAQAIVLLIVANLLFVAGYR